jgi:hypothetical protein
MKKVITILIVAAGMYAASAKASTLKAGACNADSKADLETEISLAVDSDTQAVEQMMVEGKSFGPTDEDKTVTITNYSLSDAGVVGFVYVVVQPFIGQL